MKKEECFFLGIISKKHGYKGDVNIKLDVNAPEKFKELDYLFIDLNGNLVPFFISSLRFKNNNIALVKFEDVNDEDSANSLIGKSTYLPLDLLEEDERPLQALIHFQVIDNHPSFLLHGAIDTSEKTLSLFKERFECDNLSSSIENIKDSLMAGADKVSINSAAINNPDIIKNASEHFGNQCIVVAIDVKKIGSSWMVHSHGGTINTNIEAFGWLEKTQNLGAGEILLTSMDRDGTKLGFDIELLSKASKILDIPLIASGGVGKIDHFYEGADKGQADALLAASVFHFNEISIMEVKEFLKTKNIAVRL